MRWVRVVKLLHLNLVRIILETWNLVSTHTYVVLENIAFITKTLLILLMSGFFGKNQLLLAKTAPLLKAIV